VNSLKTLLGATLLAALAYGVYVGITKKPGATTQVDAPSIEPGVLTKHDLPPLPVERTGAALAGDEAPAFDAAPPFDAGVANQEGPAPASDNRYAEQNFPDDGPPPPVVSEAAPPMAEGALADPYPSSADATSVAAETSTATAASVLEQELVAIEPLLQSGQLAEAHLALSKLYGNPSLTPEEDSRLTALLSQLAGTVIYSRQHLLDAPHRVAPGETLEQIATACNVPWELLAKINGLPGAGPLEPGQELKIIKGPFHAVVDLQQKQLVLFLNGERYAGRFPIAVGADHPPLPGEHHVVQNKLLNPSYYAERVYTPEDPQNPLGSRKIELDQQVSIHGSNDPSSLDREDPRGCIRMNPRDIEDVFDILTIGSEVAVRR